MAIFRCKMCGGDLQVVEGTSYCTCDSCGTTQTIPTVQEEGLKNLFNRANVLRMKAEFDRAAEIYEKILQQNAKEAEAYWGLILCKYGIEYVEDPVTYKRIPTCHRASYDPVVTDEDYKNALRYADEEQKKIYEKEAADIDEIQKGILALAQKESPYDVFICYKETDESGKRTQDSVIANEIYHQLTNEGLKVFYAAITLEDKLGKEYEPYIFSALHTAKVMLVLGTKPEYFSAVWVKNEWSRFLKIMKKDHSRLLIPCFRDMDPYELPEEFSHLQAQDMAKIGFISDLIRGIKKVVDIDLGGQSQGNTPVMQQNIVNQAGNVDALYKRGEMALEDHEWKKADKFFEEVLNQNAEFGRAYLGKLLAKEEYDSYEKLISGLINRNEERKVGGKFFACEEDTEHIERMIKDNVVSGYLEESNIKKEYEGFKRWYMSALPRREAEKEEIHHKITMEPLWNRAEQYADPALKTEIQDGLDRLFHVLDERISQAKKEDEDAATKIRADYKEFLRQADDRVEKLNADAKEKVEKKYKLAVSCMEAAKTDYDYSSALLKFKFIEGYKDVDQRIKICEEKARELRAEVEEQRKELARKKKRKKRIIWIIILAAVAALAASWVFVVKPKLEIRKDEKEKATAAEELEQIKATGLEKGSIVNFGTYGKTFDKHPIEWTILDKQDQKVLLFSNQILAEEAYNKSSRDDDSDSHVTWENCSLRKWLNDDFYNDAFSTYEQKWITESTVTTDEYDTWDADAKILYESDFTSGIATEQETQDKVFLLSPREVMKYFDSQEELLKKYDTDFCKDWWLRSDGQYDSSSSPSYYYSAKQKYMYMYVRSYLDDDGRAIDVEGTRYYYERGVCPAIWLDLSDLED